MACSSCGKRNGSSPKQTFLAKFANGETRVFNTEIEAKAAVTRKGGSYKINTK